MQRHNIPTAAFASFGPSDRAAAQKFIESNWPVVVKASGLCAGKGVIMAQTKQEAIEAFDEMQKGCFGSAGQQVTRRRERTSEIGNHSSRQSLPVRIRN